MREEGFWKIDAAGQGAARKQLALYKLGATCLKLCYVSPLSVLIPLFLLPFINQSRKLPLLCYIPLDITIPHNFFIMYTWQLLNSIAIVFFLQSMFGILIGVIATLYCQTIMLKETIERLDFRQDEQQCFQKIKNCVQLHCKLLR